MELCTLHPAILFGFRPLGASCTSFSFSGPNAPASLLESLVLGLLYESSDVCLVCFATFVTLLAGIGATGLLPLCANMCGGSFEF